MSDGPRPEQIPLIPGPAPRAARRRRPAADALPVARVVLLVPVPHLDRLFDYEVPEALSEAAQPGVRVRVRLAGRLVDGFLVERVATSDRSLQPLSSVHGPPVLTAEVAALCRTVADRYAGTLADVLRFAVPPRHARVEAAFPGLGAAVPAPDRPASEPSGGEPSGTDAPGAKATADAGWARYRGGAALRAGIGSGPAMRALWVAAPAESIGARIADLVVAVAARGRGALIVVPDAADVARIAGEVERVLGEGVAGPTRGRVVRLVADAGPESRYRTFLSIRCGSARVVVGTRAAVFAPVADLGMILVWDDGDESLGEPQAPGWHAREVAALRSAQEDISLVVGGPSVTLEAERMVDSGWLVPVEVPRPVLRSVMPRVQVSADVSRGGPEGAARIPPVALEVLRAGIAIGPVLVGVPRSGYLPGVACQACREQVRCPACEAPMRAEGPDRRPSCPTHGPAADWCCPFCGGTTVRATAVGVRRTAEEFGRALPGVPVVTSSGAEPVRSLVRPRSLAVATPGAEPDPGPQGYAALVLLDVGAALSRPGLRVAEEVVRRWFQAAAKVRSAPEGGRVLVVSDPGVREVQALVRWDPRGYAARELAERRELSLPPAVRTALLTGPALEVGALADAICAELGATILRRSGPIGDPQPGAGTPAVSWLLAVSLTDGAHLAAALQRAQAARSARRAPVVTVRMDPARLR